MCVLYNIYRLAFFLCFLSCWLVFVALFCALIVCDCFRAVFGQCRTPKTAQRAKHSRTAAKGTPSPVLSCLPVCLCYRCIIYHYARACLQGATPPPARGTFSVRFDDGKAPNPSCSSPNSLVQTSNSIACTHNTLLLGFLLGRRY